MTTKEGIPTRATSSPIRVPITRPVSRPAGTARYQGAPSTLIVLAITPAEAPPATPAERSMSPRSSTKVRPIASTMIDDAWTMRLAMLIGDGKVSGRRAENRTKSTTRPRTAGREPMSPARTRWT